MTQSIDASDIRSEIPFLPSASLADATVREDVLRPWPSNLSQDDLEPAGRYLLIGGVVLAHLLGGWALWQVNAVPPTVMEAAPIMISMIAPAEQPKPTPAPPPPKVVQPRKVVQPQAPLLAAAPSPAPQPAVFVAPQSVVPEPVAAPVSAAPPAPVPPAPAPTPPAPKQIPPSAVRYLVEPRMSVPLLSRRLKESGIVYLHIVVDVRGMLKDAKVSKSSGFTRLDEQALEDIRSARFVPQTESGQPIEWQTTAPLAYEVD